MSFRNTLGALALAMLGLTATLTTAHAEVMEPPPNIARYFGFGEKYVLKPEDAKNVGWPKWQQVTVLNENSVPGTWCVSLVRQKPWAAAYFRERNPSGRMLTEVQGCFRRTSEVTAALEDLDLEPRDYMRFWESVNVGFEYWVPSFDVSEEEYIAFLQGVTPEEIVFDPTSLAEQIEAFEERLSAVEKAQDEIRSQLDNKADADRLEALEGIVSDNAEELTDKVDRNEVPDIVAEVLSGEGGIADRLGKLTTSVEQLEARTTTGAGITILGVFVPWWFWLFLVLFIALWAFYYSKHALREVGRSERKRKRFGFFGAERTRPATGVRGEIHALGGRVDRLDERVGNEDDQTGLFGRFLGLERRVESFILLQDVNGKLVSDEFYQEKIEAMRDGESTRVGVNVGRSIRQVELTKYGSETGNPYFTVQGIEGTDKYEKFDAVHVLKKIREARDAGRVEGLVRAKAG